MKINDNCLINTRDVKLTCDMKIDNYTRHPSVKWVMWYATNYVTILCDICNKWWEVMWYIYYVLICVCDSMCYLCSNIRFSLYLKKIYHLSMPFCTFETLRTWILTKKSI